MKKHEIATFLLQGSTVPVARWEPFLNECFGQVSRGEDSADLLSVLVCIAKKLRAQSEKLDAERRTQLAELLKKVEDERKKNPPTR